MAVSAERLAINPSLRNGIDSLVAIEAKELGNDSGRGDLDENNVVETNTVEGVEEGKTALNFVGLDHSLKNIVYGQALTLTGEVVRNSENGTEIVGRVTPFSSEETVVVIEPTDLSTNVKGTTNGVELIICSGDTGTIGNSGSFNNGAQEFRALRETKRLETTANGVNQAESGRLESKVRLNLVAMDIVGNILKNLVRLWTQSRFSSVVGRHGTRDRGREARNGSYRWPESRDGKTS